MTTIQRYVAGAVALLLLLGLAYCSGKKAGRIDEKLNANKLAIVANDSVTKLVTSRTDSAKKRTAVLDSAHDVIRTRVKVVHDTITVDSTTVYVDQELADLIQVDDSLLKAQKRTLALDDTLIASLFKGQNLRDTRIKLLESQGPSRISRGIQVGIGYCQTATSRTPCVYAGYGFTLRL